MGCALGSSEFHREDGTFFNNVDEGAINCCKTSIPFFRPIIICGNLRNKIFPVRSKMRLFPRDIPLFTTIFEKNRKKIHNLAEPALINGALKAR